MKPLNMQGSRFVVRIMFAFLFVFSSFWAEGQIASLANQYYNSGEYEKAADLYRRIVASGENRDFSFQRLTDCLIYLKAFDEAEQLLLDEISSKPREIQLFVILGNVYERKGELDRATAQYEKAIGLLDNNMDRISQLAMAFTSLTLYSEAIRVYEKGGQLLNNKKAYAFSLADLYRRKGDEKNMITNYLLCAEQFSNNLDYLIKNLEENLSPESYEDLQGQLYQFIQAEPDKIVYPELLQWTFVHFKEYDKALRQARAMDRKLGENGGRVFEVGTIAYNDDAYDTAIEAFSFIVDNKPINSSYFLDAKRSLLNAKRKKVTQTYTYTKEDLISLDQEYLSFIDSYGRNTQTAQLMIEYAEFNALFLNDLVKARGLLEEVIQFGGLAPFIRAEAKLKLGDYFLMEGERWEASLLFSQVDKDFKEGELGEQARFRNARLSYFMGDFEWAQEQFDILKSATTRLISNDAIDLSVFIMDNLNLDTTALPMEWYAASEMLIFQNRFDEAIAKLDSITLRFPEHTLQDDILYAKAQIAKKRLRPEKAVLYYQEIIEKFPEEIRCDNAMYELARLYETSLDDKEKAKELYKKIFMDYASSTFAIDARKRFRLLRNEAL